MQTKSSIHPSPLNEGRPKISATIITKNEEANIGQCLETLAWADEIVVVDSESTDRTLEIARNYTAKIFVHRWEGQGRQKNRAVDLAAGPWIFSIDADERVPPDLATEIQSVIVNTSARIFSIRRKNYYRGQWIRHGGWWPDRVKRLFIKGDTRFNEKMIHDSLIAHSAIEKLDAALLHYSFRSISDFMARAAWYADHQAHEMYCHGKRANLFMAVSHALFALLRTYLLRFGFMDGSAGVLIAVSNFVGVFYRYMLLRELTRDGRAKEPII